MLLLNIGCACVCMKHIQTIVAAIFNTICGCALYRRKPIYHIHMYTYDTWRIQFGLNSPLFGEITANLCSNRVIRVLCSDISSTVKAESENQPVPSSVTQNSIYWCSPPRLIKPGKGGRPHRIVESLSLHWWLYVLQSCCWTRRHKLTHTDFWPTEESRQVPVVVSCLAFDEIDYIHWYWR